MAILENTEKVSFEDKPNKERDLILRDCVLGLFLDNELKEDRIAELERKIGILQNKCKVNK